MQDDVVAMHRETTFLECELSQPEALNLAIPESNPGVEGIVLAVIREGMESCYFGTVSQGRSRKRTLSELNTSPSRIERNAPEAPENSALLGSRVIGFAGD
jgi:hypothetical protein